MTLYDLILNVSQIITPDTNAFYHYILYTSDDNGGFLRTRYCWSSLPIADRSFRYDYKKIMVTAKSPLTEEVFVQTPETNAKIQFSYGIMNPSISDAEWDAQLGYRHVYIFDLIKKTYEYYYTKLPVYYK